MRVPNRFRTLQAYGGNAKPFLPQLREMRKRWKSGEHRDLLEQTIQVIEADKDPMPLISLHDLVDERLDKDLSQTESDEEKLVRCRQLMKKWPDDAFYQSAALRKIVAIQGGEAFKELTAVLGTPSEILHQTAVVLASQLPDTNTDSWVRLLEQSDGRQLAGILDVLGERQDPRAISAVGKYREHPEAVVREAAQAAVAALEAAKNSADAGDDR